MSLARYLSKLGALLNSSGQVLTSGHADGSVTPAKLSADAQYMGMKNRIINGAMRIDQRNAGAAKTLTAGVQAYVLDRFYVQTNGGAGVVQQVAGSGGFTKAMRITGASGVTDGYFGQKIESYNIADAASSTVTYKLRASSSTLTSLTWYARYPNSQDNYAGVTLITSGSITINSTPTDYTFQIALPSGVTNGFEVYFTFGAFTSGTLDITGVQLEKGSTATSFDYRPYTTEEQLCRRYKRRVKAATTFANFGTGRAYSTTNCQIMLGNAVPMRATPTFSYSALTDFNAAQSAGNITAMVLGQNVTDWTQFSIDVTATFTLGACCVMNANNTTNAYLDFDAEL